MKIRDVWNRVVKGSYTRSLEEEVARLRAENRALLNSILGIAGMPPVLLSAADFASEQKKQSDCLGQSDSTQKAGHGSMPTGQRTNPSHGQRRMLGVPAPVRHRSWQQVNRMLELDVMRNREKPTDQISRTTGLDRNGR